MSMPKRNISMHVLVFLVQLIWNVTGLLEFSKSLQDLYTIRTIQCVSIVTCKLACESRQRCKSAIYYRDAYHCTLMSTDALTNSTVVSRGTVLLNGFHSSLDQNGSYSNCGGRTCLPQETCTTKTQGNISSQVCEIKECQNPQGLLPKGAKIEGNIYTVGSKLRVGCEHHMETIQCKSDGNWTNSSSIAVLDLDCTDLQGCSGVYPTLQNYQVHCDMDTDQGHWLRIMDGSVNFYRNWADYKNGFGGIHGEFWLGLELVHTIVQNGDYELRIDMENYHNETRFAKYSTFSIGDEASKYTLTVTGYSGDAGDMFNDTDGNPFSTFDKDNDNLAQNCAVVHMGGWWYGIWGYCYICNLNGLYGEGMEGNTNWKLIHWNSWTASGNHPLRITEMKIRRK